MAICRGKRKNNAPCNTPLYRCRKCSAVGCKHVRDECTNQAFRNSGQCKSCGSTQKDKV